MQVNDKRGYCQLEFGGKVRTLHFSMNFWAAFENAAGFSISEIDKVLGAGLSLTTLRAMIYAGILAYDQENKQVIDYDQFDVGNWMEDVKQANIQLIVETLMQSRILGNDLNAGVRRNVEKSTKNPKPKNP
jgi:hypothetical protein